MFLEVALGRQQLPALLMLAFERLQPLVDYSDMRLKISLWHERLAASVVPALVWLELEVYSGEMDLEFALSRERLALPFRRRVSETPHTPQRCQGR